MIDIAIIGAGLAGTEAALQLSSHGYPVRLYDSKPNSILPLYKFSSPAELVCNNSLGTITPTTPTGLLLHELKMVNSALITIANKNRVLDEKYFAVDKQGFSLDAKKALSDNGIEIIKNYIEKLPDADVVLLATGPLTNDILISNLMQFESVKEIHFTDASSIVIDINSIDMQNATIKQVSNDLFIVKLRSKDIDELYENLCHFSKTNEGIEEKLLVYEKSQSIENIALSGKQKLINAKLLNCYLPNTPSLLLRREKALYSGFIVVGFMTSLRNADQTHILQSVPGFKNVRIIKYGRMHRNTFLNTGGNLDPFFKLKNSNVYILGQLSGLDGYTPAILSGYLAAQGIIYNHKISPPSLQTMIGALANYVSSTNVTDFQPMSPSFSLMHVTSSNVSNILNNSEKDIHNFLKQLT